MSPKTRYLKYDPLFTLFTRHRCPKCGSVLKSVRAEKTIDPRTHNELSEFDSVRLVFREFECKTCSSHFSVSEIEQHEKDIKRRH